MLKTQNMISQSINKIKNGKTVVLSEMVKITGEAGTDMITDLVNQIIMVRVIPAKYELSTIVKCLRGTPIFWKKETIVGLN